MGLTTKTLCELLDYKDSERLQLPEIQRDFVWPKQSVKLLFDSLYRGLPIGQMLVWKPKTEVKGKAFHGQKRRRTPSKLDGFYGYLLDGQQRLTAVSQVRDACDEYPLMFNLWTDGEREDSRFYWDKFLDDSDPWYVSVADVLSKDFDVTAHLHRLEEDDYYEDRHAETVRKMLAQLQNVLNYVISVIEYESDDYRDATELFIRFNSTGRKLNKSDLVLAELANRVEGLTSKEMSDVLSKYRPHFQFSRSFLMQCLAAVHTNRMNFSKPEKLFGDSSPSDIRASWHRTVRGLEDVIDFVTGTVRWDSGAWVPSFNALIPLVYIKAQKRGWTKAEREVARKWLLLAGVRTYFSGSVYSELDQILRKLEANASVDQLWDITRRYLRKLSVDDFDTKGLTGNNLPT
ncbi:MAG: DUF262 domain-containing protein [Chloroflexi bacterium]|nr:DUF262 domain-containing protein [Chloroflexota bacterium]